MAIEIRNVSADFRTPDAAVAAPATGSPAGGGAGSGGGVIDGLSDAALRERLRPIVMDILNAELESLRRRHG